MSFYDLFMAKKTNASHLRALREAVGISVRELARQIGEHHTNVSYWETSGNLPRSNVLIPMAKALGVTVEELLGERKARQSPQFGGKARQMFEAVSKLPHRQQQKILDLLEPFIREHTSASSRSSKT